MIFLIQIKMKIIIYLCENLLMKQKNYINNFKIIKNINLSKFKEVQKLDPPLSFKDIFCRLDEKEWLKAVENELNNMKIKNVYLIDKNIPDNKNLISRDGFLVTKEMIREE